MLVYLIKNKNSLKQPVDAFVPIRSHKISQDISDSDILHSVNFYILWRDNRDFIVHIFYRDLDVCDVGKFTIADLNCQIKEPLGRSLIVRSLINR